MTYPWNRGQSKQLAAEDSNMTDNDELVTIKTYTMAVYAETDKVHLEAHGIPAFVADDNTVMADYFLGNALGYIKLQVPRSRAEEALQIVQLHQSELHAFEKGPRVDESNRCLSCGQWMDENEDRCPKCGWSFTDDAEDEPA